VPDLERLVHLVRAGLGFESGVPPLQDDEIAVWKLARDHKVATILSSGLLNFETAPSLTDEARYIWQLAGLRAEYYVRKCDEICALFRKEGIWVTPLKGVPLAREAYPKPGQRVFRDLDLLIRPADVEAAHRLLIERGFALIEPTGPLHRAARVKGDPLAAAAAGIDAVSYQEGDLFLEIHTRILPPIVGRYPLGGEWAPEDFLAHLLTHATRHHFLYGLRHLADVAVWCRAKKPSWDLVREKIASADLEHLAHPAWKLSSERFPETVPPPPPPANRVIRIYTDRTRKRFAEMPLLAVSLSGSPFPFILMRPGRMKLFMATVRGTQAQADYQLGKSRPTWKRVLWMVWRPFGLVWRHAPVLWRWLRFAL
jgi:hypothetical protein